MGKYKFDFVVMCAALTLLGYIGWHVFHGARSLENRDRLLAKAQELETMLAVAESRRARIDQRVQLMRPETVDPDMLDELARQTLDYAGSDDFVVLTTGSIP